MHTKLLSVLEFFDLLQLVLEPEVSSLKVLDVLVLSLHDGDLLLQSSLRGLHLLRRQVQICLKFCLSSWLFRRLSRFLISRREEGLGIRLELLIVASFAVRLIILGRLKLVAVILLRSLLKMLVKICHLQLTDHQDQ